MDINNKINDKINDFYIEQYNVYKKKYLELKKFVCCGYNGNNSYNLYGGYGGFFNNTTKFYFMANVTNKELYNKLDERRSLLLKGGQPNNPIVHLTLLQFEVNQDHPLSYFFYSKKLQEKLKKFYKNEMINKKVYLTTNYGKYDLFGIGENKFFVKLYEPNKELAITKFRTLFYKYLKKELGKYTIKKNNKGKKIYYVFVFNNKPLFAVPDFYYGKGVWKPHVTIFNINDLKKHNRSLYNKYDKKRTKKEKLQVLFTPIINKKLEPIGKIRMYKDIGNLTLSLRNPYMKIDREYII